MKRSHADVRGLYEALRPLQEKKGYYFNKDETLTLPLLEELLGTKERYGYMVCPCRLANGEYAKDKDILCPCVYREKDVAEFGVCFCGLYASKDYNEGNIPFSIVPDRRPPENIVL